MANEADTGKIIIVETPFPEDISWVYKNETFSDIILQCNKEKVHAHKVILATRCPYFRSILVQDPKMSEFTMNGVSVKVFRKIIQYIYTGSLALVSSDTPLIFEVMKLASKFSLKSLELKISEEISSTIDTENVLKLLNEAIMYKMEGLKNKCYTFIDECPFEILESDSIQSLTQKSMVSLLERNSLDVPEIDIFRSVQRWCQVNKDKNNLVVNCVRLNRLSNEEILTVVFPSKLIENQKLLEIMARSVDDKPKSPNSGHPLIENENLASRKRGAQVISGQNTSWLLLDRDNDINVIQNQWAFHSANDKNGITIKLKKPFWTNHIQMRLPDDVEERYSSYYIEASQDQKTWHRIIDYSRYRCCSFQYLYFDQVLAQFFRIIIGTWNPRQPSVLNSHQRFELYSFKLYWKSNTPKVKDGIVCPKENIFRPSMISTRFNHHPSTLFYNLTSVDRAVPNSYEINLGQPYWISRIRIRRKNDCPPRTLTVRDHYEYFQKTQNYDIKVSLDRVNWQTITNSTNTYNLQPCSPWHEFVFPERCVVYISGKFNFANNITESVSFNRDDFEIM